MRHISGDSVRECDQFFTVLYSTPHTQIATMVLEPGQESGELGTDHPQADQVLFLLQGQVQATVGDESFLMEEGDSVVIQAGERHQIVGAGDRAAKTLNVYGPPAYPLDD